MIMRLTPAPAHRPEARVALLGRSTCGWAGAGAGGVRPRGACARGSRQARDAENSLVEITKDVEVATTYDLRTGRRLASVPPHSVQRIPVGPSGHTDARLGLRCRSWSQPQSLCTAQQPHLDAPLQCERSAHTLQGVEVDQAGKGHVPRFDGGGHTGPQEPIFGSRRDHPGGTTLLKLW